MSSMARAGAVGVASAFTVAASAEASVAAPAVSCAAAPTSTAAFNAAPDASPDDGVIVETSIGGSPFDAVWLDAVSVFKAISSRLSPSAPGDPSPAEPAPDAAGGD